MRVTPETRGHAEALLACRLGLRFPRERHAELDRALLEAARASRTPSVEALLARLAELPDGSAEWGRLAARVTVGETYFLRDHACFDALEHRVLPPLIAARRARGDLHLRLWSAGCATGEEAHSLSILLNRLLPDRRAWDATVLGTDVNPEALAAARHGVYREWSLRDVPAGTRERYFTESAGGFELDFRVRAGVVFEHSNLAAGLPPRLAAGSLDVILCRNVLMYFTPDAACSAVLRLQAALAPGGWLAVAPAEASHELLQPLRPARFRGAVFYSGQGPPSAPPPEPARQPPVAWVRPAQARHPKPAPAREPPACPRFEGAPLDPLDTAQALADRGGLEAAERLCRSVIERDRLHLEAHRLLAAIQQERGEVEAARDTLRRLLYLAPDSPEAHLALGNLLLQCGDRPGGLRHLRTAQRLAARSEAPKEAVP